MTIIEHCAAQASETRPSMLATRLASTHSRLSQPASHQHAKLPFISLTLSSPLSKSPPQYLSSQASRLPSVESCRSYGWPFTSTNSARV